MSRNANRMFNLQVAELVGECTLVGMVRGCIKRVGTELGAGDVKMGCILGLRVSPKHRLVCVALTHNHNHGHTTHTHTHTHTQTDTHSTCTQMCAHACRYKCVRTMKLHVMLIN